MENPIKIRKPRSANKAEPHVVKVKALISAAYKAEVQLATAKQRQINSNRKPSETVALKTAIVRDAWLDVINGINYLLHATQTSETVTA
jgi:hypothetical protein